jgi:hypothetical protein
VAHASLAGSRPNPFGDTTAVETTAWHEIIAAAERHNAPATMRRGNSLPLWAGNGAPFPRGPIYIASCSHRTGARSPAVSCPMVRTRANIPRTFGPGSRTHRSLPARVLSPCPTTPTSPRDLCTTARP